MTNKLNFTIEHGGKDDLIVVTGGGGFIGGWLVGRLLELGYRRIRSVDIKPLNEWFQLFPEAENVVADLRDFAACRSACRERWRRLQSCCRHGRHGFHRGA